jgi:hypothetical protein
MMRFGFSEAEYSRVRDWLISAIDANPGLITEAELIANLRSYEWHLLTSENAACVLQMCIYDGEQIANVLLIGGEKNKALREILACGEVFYDYLRAQNFTKLVGTARKGFHNILKKAGFKQEQEELQKELN